MLGEIESPISFGSTPLTEQYPGYVPSLLDVAGDIEMPEIPPQLTGNIFIPVVSMQMQPATPAGYGVPRFTPPTKDTWGQLQDWAEANKTVVIVASIALGAMVMLGGKRR